MNIVIAIIALAIPAIIVVACVQAIRQALRASGKQSGAATCGKCSYEIADLSFDRCPECGGLLLEVGIVTPSLVVRRSSGAMGLVGAWTLLVLFVGMLSFGVVGGIWSMMDANLPRGAYSHFKSSYTYQPAEFSRSGDYSVSLDFDLVTGRDAKVRSGAFDLAVTSPNQTTPLLQFDAVTLRILAPDEQVSGADVQQSLSHALVLGVFESAGLDTTDQAIAFEADQIVTIIRRVAAQPNNSAAPTGRKRPDARDGLRQMSRSGSRQNAPSLQVVAGLNREDLLLIIGGGFWLIVYIVGLRLMLLGRKRALETTG